MYVYIVIIYLKSSAKRETLLNILNLKRRNSIGDVGCTSLSGGIKYLVNLTALNINLW